MEDNILYMRRALELAAQGRGHTSPNPMVGCVVVKDGRIISEDYHHRYGEYHAERNALSHCTEDPVGADLYVTLEPCCHYGKTPPCTDIILEKKIGRVFVGAMDTNPLVGGKGIAILREHGIPVETGILEAECRAQNEVFFHYIETGRPLVVMKYAMTLDGKIACESGDARWVTGEEARRHVHGLRGYYRGILVGIGTVLADDPLLNCRIPGGRDPVRIVCDSSLRIPLTSQLVRTAGDIPLIVVCAQEVGIDAEKARSLEVAGVRILRSPGRQVDLSWLMETLGQEKIDSVLVEGGGTLNASLLREGLADRVYAYVAPKIVGGADARTPVEGQGVARMAEALTLENREVLTLGEDICITGQVRK
ncbi:MAG: bifunctional diaminohydroxyphosphoribosylaminopyrimidine deaminase/5-amino-6-(5-phosphoribosylamino)uracil reductase RibD [Lachnospiraceae bacterium]|nr:bifunctional diaminohydroxyphosphoribosylaminopyrimidine deaminase/5-amino-6-(5-phosphoribosylamino)uracil reductase RibD [Lachnospiraceae bacterium]